LHLLSKTTTFCQLQEFGIKKNTTTYLGENITLYNALKFLSLNIFLHQPELPSGSLQHFGWQAF
jgi:hypothetical protein